MIGAGLGGLCCAVELAQQGFRVAVLEQHDKPGGYAHAFTRRGFTFDVSLHHLGGLDEGALLRGVLTRLGVLDRLTLRRREALMRVELPGHDLTLPNDTGALLASLGERFPAEREGLSALFAFLRQLKHHVTGPSTDPDFAVPPAERLSALHAEDTLAEVLDRYLADPALKAIITTPWAYLGLPPSKVTALFSTCVLGSTWMEGAWQLEGGGSALAAALVARLEALGGVCLTRAPVGRILVEEGCVAGVALEDGRPLRAPIVVSNANPYQTYRSLVPEGALSKPFLARLERLEPSVSFLALYLGLDVPPSAVGVTEDEHHVLQSVDPDEAWGHLQTGMLEQTDWSIASYERSDPDAARAGGGVVSVMELCPAGDWLELDPEAYRARKAQVQARLLAKVIKRFPAIEGHIQVAELATPRTMARYTRNHQGAVYGFAQTPAQAGPRRLGNRAPLPGLFLTGAWTWAGGGYEGALMTGLQSADAVLAAYPAPTPNPRPRLTARPEELPPLPLLLPEVAPAFPQRLPVQAYQDAVDAHGAVDPTAVLRFLDRGRVEACEATCDLTGQGSWLSRYLVNVYRIEARFLAPASLGDALTVATGLRRVSSHRASFDQRITDARSGRVVVEAGVEVTFLDPELGLVPVPSGFDDRPSPWPQAAEGPQPVPRGEKGHHRHAQPLRVYYEDTDAQRIVYHVTYLRWCMQAVEGLAGGRPWRIARADLRYLEAARFADRLEIRLGARAGGGVLDLRIARGERALFDAMLEVAWPAGVAPAVAELAASRT
ncbi:MAG: FAD-dependent oxidoreductase [Pseudomonadota bacterium]